MFFFGKTSLARLDGVHPDLVAVEEHAIKISEVDFGVHEGVRTIERQKLYVKQKVSWTMDSKHLPQADGYSHAVDNVPFIDGVLRWEWGPIFHIADAMRTAAIELDVRLRWGGVWDMQLNDLPAGADKLQEAVDRYCVRHPGVDRIDGPHFELVSA